MRDTPPHHHHHLFLFVSRRTMTIHLHFFIRAHISPLPDVHSSFPSSPFLTFVSCLFFPPLFVSPRSYSTSISIVPRPPSSGLQVSHANKQTCTKTSLYPSPLFPPLFFPLPLFSLWGKKGKLAASFSLPKGLFKLETLQSPHSPPLPPPLSVFLSFLTSSSQLGVTSFFTRRWPRGPRQCQATLFCGMESVRRMGWKRGKEMRKRRESGSGVSGNLPVCFLWALSSSHGSFLPDEDLEMTSGSQSELYMNHLKLLCLKTSLPSTEGRGAIMILLVFVCVYLFVLLAKYLIHHVDEF